MILLLQALSLLIPLLPRSRGPALSVAYIAYIGFCTIINALNLKLHADADHVGFRINYGFTRGIGSIAYVLISVLWQLGASFILQAPSYALYMTAVVYYVKESISFRDSAKAQSLAFTSTTFGGMLASVVGGQLYDHLSVISTLWVAFAIGMAGAIIVFLGTRKPALDA